MEEWECHSTGNQNPERPVHTTRPRMPAKGTTAVASPKAELGWLDPPMNIEKIQRVWSYSSTRPVPANTAEPNGQILDLGAIRAIDLWGRSGLVLKWRRWKVAFGSTVDARASIWM